jgi:hypothetical protein
MDTSAGAVEALPKERSLCVTHRARIASAQERWR